MSKKFEVEIEKRSTKSKGDWRNLPSGTIVVFGNDVNAVVFQNVHFHLPRPDRTMALLLNFPDGSVWGDTATSPGYEEDLDHGKFQVLGRLVGIKVREGDD